MNLFSFSFFFLHFEQTFSSAMKFWCVKILLHYCTFICILLKLTIKAIQAMKLILFNWRFSSLWESVVFWNGRYCFSMGFHSLRISIELKAIFKCTFFLHPNYNLAITFDSVTKSGKKRKNCPRWWINWIHFTWMKSITIQWKIFFISFSYHVMSNHLL